MCESDIWEDFEYFADRPTAGDMDRLMEKLLQNPDSEKGWELFRKMFDNIIAKGSYYAQCTLPDPLSFRFFLDDYGNHPGMEEIVRRYFSVYFPLEEEDIFDTAKSLLVYLCVRVSDDYGWAYFKTIFRSLPEDQQKELVPVFCNHHKRITPEEFTEWLLS